MEKLTTLPGDQRLTDLGNEVSAAISKALKAGLGTDVAVSVALCVAADYGRLEYGNQYLTGLARVVKERANHTLPAQQYDH